MKAVKLTMLISLLPIITYSLHRDSSSLSIDNNRELEDFIRRRRSEGWSATRIANKWNEQHWDQIVSYKKIGRWFYKKGLYKVNRIDNNRELEDFIRRRRSEGWSATRIANKWNEQHWDQIVSYKKIGGWLYKKGLYKSKIDNNRELESFIRRRRSEGWGPTRIADAWYEQQNQTISGNTIGVWLRREGLSRIKQKQ